MRTKGLIVVCVLLIAIFGAWEMMNKASKSTNSTPLPTPELPSVMQPSPVTMESRPAPPPISVKKSLVAPVPVPKKVVVVQKPIAKPIVAPTPPPQISAPTPPVMVPPPEPLPPLEWQGNDTSVTHVGQIVIHNDHQWVHFWSEHHPHEAAPEIDFTQNMVIGVFAGPRPAEQFTISIMNVRTLSGSLVVDYRERLPPVGTFAVNVTVYPYHLKAIPQSKLPVKFNMLQPEGVVR